jgi:hypothetical protein
MEKFWNSLWSMNIPRKVQLFMWKVSHNILPTCKNLFDRGISSSSSCVVCTEEPESIHHLLWECDLAKEVWSKSSLCSLVQSLPSTNVQNIFQLTLQAGNVRDIALFSAISWNLWRHRNELAHGTSVDNSISLLRKAEDLVFSFEAATKATEPRNPPLIVDRSPSRWSPPPLHFFKLNFSVLLDKSHGTIGLGCLVRDHLGRVAAACSEPVSQPLDPTLLWPFALLRAVMFTRDSGFFDLTIEGECKTLFRALSTVSDLSQAGLLIDDIKYILSSFRVVNFNPVCSGCNRASQKLAKLACGQDSSEVWLGVCPPIVLDIVTNDSLVS